MLKSRFFHRFITGNTKNNHISKDVAKWCKYAGFSVFIAKQLDGTFNVTHTMCGRKEKNFSKAKARQVIRAFVEQGKNTANVTLQELPQYLAQFRQACLQHPSSDPVRAGVDEFRMAFKFVEN